MPLKSLSFNVIAMYHPGKVIKLFSHKDKDVISADESLHALVEMWDENIFTVLVDQKIAPKVREGDIVIVDYYPISPQSQIPKRLVTKILRGKGSELLWSTYKSYHRRQGAIRETVPEHHEHHDQSEYMG